MSRKAGLANAPDTTEQTGKTLTFPHPCVYCGPTVPNVARQYTVYSYGIPQELEAFIQEHKAARRLMVPTERFAETRKRLETPGTAEYVMYQKVRSEM